MNDIQMLGIINDIINYINSYDLTKATAALKEIRTELTMRVTESCDVKNVSILKAAQKFASQCAKNRNAPCGCNGANRYTDGCGNSIEYITDGYHMAAYDESFGDSIVRADGEGRNFDVVVRHAMNQNNTVTIPSYKELKRLDIAARKNKIKDAKIVLENGTCVVLGYLLQIMECIGIADECADSYTEWKNDSMVSTVYIRYGNAQGLVMPVGYNADSPSIVKDYSVNSKV